MVLYARLITRGCARGSYLILEDGAHMQTADLAQGFQEALFGKQTIQDASCTYKEEKSELFIWESDMLMHCRSKGTRQTTSNTMGGDNSPSLSVSA